MVRSIPFPPYSTQQKTVHSGLAKIHVLGGNGPREIWVRGQWVARTIWVIPKMTVGTKEISVRSFKWYHYLFPRAQSWMLPKLNRPGFTSCLPQVWDLGQVTSSSEPKFPNMYMKIAIILCSSTARMKKLTRGTLLHTWP